MFYILNIQKSVNSDNLLCLSHLRLKSKSKISKDKWNSYLEKLSNNIARSKSQIFNIASFNKFHFFFTQTCSSTYNRKDLKGLISRFRKQNYYLQRKYPNKNFHYLIIPEFHADNQSYHLHGLLSYDYIVDLHKNTHGFLELNHFTNVGYNSVSVIKNYTACTKYITKYITKDSFNCISKGDRAYYCSKGLIRKNLIDSKIVPFIPPVHFDYKSDFCFKACISNARLLKMYLDMKNKQYYNIV